MNGIQDTEPVRLYVYGALAPLLAVLVWYGIVDDASVGLWLALAGALLGVAGTEFARSKAYAPATVEQIRAGSSPVE